MMNGIILKAVSGFYYCFCEGETYECKARGSFRSRGVTPLVGDYVTVIKTGDRSGVIDSVLPRKTELARPAVANIEKLFIVSSYSTPAPSALVIDRLTALAIFHGITPVIVFNKCDMGDFLEWSRLYSRAGFNTYVVSAKCGQGLEALKAEMKNCISAFTGNSGVGKSSILNALFQNFRLATGDVSQKLGRGRHTTRHTELLMHPFNGYVTDTPGFSALENDIGDCAFKEGLAECFPDFAPFLGSCRFTSCTHTKESGCRIIQAVKDGEIEASRHNSYIKIFEELKDLKPWSTQKRKNQ